MKFIASVLATSLMMVLLTLPAALAADEPPPFKDTPQEYGLLFERPNNLGDQAKLQARTGDKVFAAAENDYVIEREKAYLTTGSYPASDAATVEGMVKKKQAILLSNGTKVQFIQSFLITSDEGLTVFSQVRILSGPAKDKVAYLGRSECFAFEAFPLKAGDEGMLGKGQLTSSAAGIAVVGEVPAFNALLRSWRDGEPRKNNTQARQAESVWFQEPGTRVKVKAVACTTDRTDHYGLAGGAVNVEVLDGRDKGKSGWAFPESVIRAAGELADGKASRGVAAKAAVPAGWVAVKSEKDGFAVEMPGQPNLNESESGDGGGTTILGYRARGLEMVVAVVNGPGEISGKDGAKALASIRDRVAAKFAGGARVEWQREDSLGSLRGLEFGLTVAKSSAGPLKGQGRAFAAGKTSFILLVVSDAQGERIPREVSRFIRSFAPTGLATMAEGEAPKSKPTGKSAEARWGSEVDPDGDVAIRQAARKLTMKIPGTPHILAPERDKMNAPRVVAPEQGNFVVTVRVDGAFQPSDKSTLKGLSSRQAAGLILWKDAGNYLVFQRRASAGDEGKDANQVVLEEQVAGDKGVTHRPAAPVGPLFLRLERTRGKIAAAFSSDGKEWKDLKPVATTWAEGEVQVGVVAVSTSATTHEVTFDNYSMKAK